MNSILTGEGEYLRTDFTGKNGYWELIATTSTAGGALSCNDTFINRKTGKYLTAKRKEIYKSAEAKLIF